MIGTILYLPLALLFMFFGLQKIEKKIWKAKKQLHDLIVCYTGYSIIGYSDEIRDGCFFETIKKRKCPAANMPNAGLSDILAEFMRGMFSFSYIGVVTALFFFFFFVWFIYYFVKPWFVRFYAFIMSYTKQIATNSIKKNISNTANTVSTKIMENKTPSSGFFSSSPFSKKNTDTDMATDIGKAANLTKVVL